MPNSAILKSYLYVLAESEITIGKQFALSPEASESFC